MDVAIRLARLQSALLDIDGKLIRHATAAPADPLAVWFAQERELLESIPPHIAHELMLRADDPALGPLDAQAKRVLERSRGAETMETVVIEQLDAIPPSGLTAFVDLLQLALIEDLVRRLAALLAAHEITDTDAGELRGLSTRIRGLAAADWDQSYWARHGADAILRLDPLSAYAGCDDDTRAAMFTALAEIAAWAGTDETAVARMAISFSESSPGAPERHAGYFLIGEGREALESHLHCRVPFTRRCGRLARRFATATYLLPIAILTVAAVFAAVRLIRLGGAGPGATIVLAASLLVLLLSLSVDVVNWVSWILLYPPHRLPRIRFRRGIPDDCRALVVVPLMLHSTADISNVLEVAEMNFLSNRDRNLGFAFLTDFPDAPQKHLPGDGPLLDSITEAVRGLNERHGSSEVKPFFLLHRDREWNEQAGRWMGWERKRGKLMELNQLIVSGSARLLKVRVGDAAALQTVRYVISLDADTRLPMGTAERLIGTLAHPLNAARSNADGSLASGFTMIQPRIRKISGARAATPFALRINQVTTVLDYLQDIHHMLFGGSLYCGKGAYDVRAFDASLQGRLPENAVLSHDHLEGMHGRVGVALDVVVSEDSPTNALAQMRQAHRWTRGDWQSLPWVFPIVPAGDGSWIRSRIAIIDRWRLLENLRQSLVPVTTIAALTAGWLLLPRHALAWTAVVLALFGHQAILLPLAGPARAAIGRSSWRGVFRESLRRLREQCDRVLLLMMFLCYQSVIVADAIARTLYRLTVSRKHLLEWTASAQASRGIRVTAGSMWREFRVSIVVTALIAAALAIRSPQSLPFAAPFLALWLFSPQLGYWTGRNSAPLPRASMNTVPSTR